MIVVGQLLTRSQPERSCSTTEPDNIDPSGEPVAVAQPSEKLVIDFGAGRERRLDSVDVDVATDMPDDWEFFSVNVSTMSFAGRRELRGDGVVAEARRVSRTEIEVTLCLDPTVVDISAGRYQGTVRFDDPRLEEVEVEAIVYAQQTNAWVWVVLAIAAGLVASVIAYSLHGRDEEEIRPNTPSQWLPVLLVIAAGFAAAFTQSAHAYTSNRSWGSGGLDGLILVGQAIALAYGATVATTDIVGLMVRSRTRRESGSSPKPTS